LILDQKDLNKIIVAKKYFILKPISIIGRFLMQLKWIPKTAF
jgi:hypothetical protein